MKDIFLKVGSFFLSALVFWIIGATISFIVGLSSDNSKEENKVKSEVKRELKNFVSHYHNWSDNKSRFYGGRVGVYLEDVKKSNKNKLNLLPISWGDFYKKIIENDKLRLSSVYELFDRIDNTKSLNRNDFADVIVSFVQNIPYNVITMDSCNEAYLKNQSVREMIDEGVSCDGNVFLGLYTPTEFISKFKGDCDTRTVFLYMVLRRYGYDTKILNSDVYGHSILGVNLPSRGRYKTHLGKRYYTWETTNLNWKLGDLPPTTSRMSNWNVVL